MATTFLTAVLTLFALALALPPVAAALTYTAAPHSFTQGFLDLLSWFLGDGMATTYQEFWLGGGWFSHLPLLLLALAIAALTVLAVRHFTEHGTPTSTNITGTTMKSGLAAYEGFGHWRGQDTPKTPGWTCGYSRLGGFYISPWSQTPHALVVAGSGSGKTRRMILPNAYQAIEAGCSLVVLDRKGELAGLMGLDIPGHFPLILDHESTDSARWDPLDPVKACWKHHDPDGALRAAQQVATAIMPEPADADPHWVLSARAFFTTCALLVCCAPDCPTSQKTLASVLCTIDEGTAGPATDPTQPLKALLKELPYSHPARAAGKQILALQGRELGSVLSTLHTILLPYQSRAVARATSGNRVTSGRVLAGRNPNLIYVACGGRGTPGNALVSLYMDQLIQEADRLSKTGELPRPMVLLLDELGNLPRIPSLPDAYTMGRSQGLRILSCVQETAQISEVYGESTLKSFIANSALKVPMAPGSPSDKKLFSELAGQTIRTTTSSSETSYGHRSRSLSQKKEYLVPPEAWGQMSDSHLVVLRDRMHAPAKCGGTFSVPTCDASKTPAADLFHLGTPEEEAQAKRLLADQVKRWEQAHRDTEIPTWTPAWPEVNEEEDLALGVDEYEEELAI